MSCKLLIILSTISLLTQFTSGKPHLPEKKAAGILEETDSDGPEDVKNVKNYSTYPKYKYSYDVEDFKTGDYKNHVEERDGDTVRGEYTITDPNGVLRTVQYTADDEHGYQAVILTSDDDQEEHQNSVSSDGQNPGPNPYQNERARIPAGSSGEQESIKLNQDEDYSRDHKSVIVNDNKKLNGRYTRVRVPSKRRHPSNGYRREKSETENINVEVSQLQQPDAFISEHQQRKPINTVVQKEEPIYIIKQNRPKSGYQTTSINNENQHGNSADFDIYRTEKPDFIVQDSQTRRPLGIDIHEPSEFNVYEFNHADLKVPKYGRQKYFVARDENQQDTTSEIHQENKHLSYRNQQESAKDFDVRVPQHRRPKYYVVDDSQQIMKPVNYHVHKSTEQGNPEGFNIVEQHQHTEITTKTGADNEKSVESEQPINKDMIMKIKQFQNSESIVIPTTKLMANMIDSERNNTVNSRPVKLIKRRRRINRNRWHHLQAALKNKQHKKQNLTSTAVENYDHHTNPQILKQNLLNDNSKPYKPKSYIQVYKEEHDSNLHQSENNDNSDHLKQLQLENSKVKTETHSRLRNKANIRNKTNPSSNNDEFLINYGSKNNFDHDTNKYIHSNHQQVNSNIDKSLHNQDFQTHQKIEEVIPSTYLYSHESNSYKHHEESGVNHIPKSYSHINLINSPEDTVYVHYDNNNENVKDMNLQTNKGQEDFFSTVKTLSESNNDHTSNHLAKNVDNVSKPNSGSRGRKLRNRNQNRNLNVKDGNQRGSIKYKQTVNNQSSEESKKDLRNKNGDHEKSEKYFEQQNSDSDKQNYPEQQRTNLNKQIQRKPLQDSKEVNKVSKNQQQESLIKFENGYKDQHSVQTSSPIKEENINQDLGKTTKNKNHIIDEHRGDQYHQLGGNNFEYEIYTDHGDGAQNYYSPLQQQYNYLPPQKQYNHLSVETDLKQGLSHIIINEDDNGIPKTTPHSYAEIQFQHDPVQSEEINLYYNNNPDVHYYNHQNEHNYVPSTDGANNQAITIGNEEENLLLKSNLQDYTTPAPQSYAEIEFHHHPNNNKLNSKHNHQVEDNTEYYRVHKTKHHSNHVNHQSITQEDSKIPPAQSYAQVNLKNSSDKSENRDISVEIPESVHDQHLSAVQEVDKNKPSATALTSNRPNKFSVRNKKRRFNPNTRSNEFKNQDSSVDASFNYAISLQHPQLKSELNFKKAENESTENSYATQHDEHNYLPSTATVISNEGNYLNIHKIPTVAFVKQGIEDSKNIQNPVAHSYAEFNFENPPIGSEKTNPKQIEENKQFSTDLSGSVKENLQQSEKDISVSSHSESSIYAPNVFDSEGKIFQGYEIPVIEVINSPEHLENYNKQNQKVVQSYDQTSKVENNNFKPKQSKFFDEMNLPIEAQAYILNAPVRLENGKPDTKTTLHGKNYEHYITHNSKNNAQGTKQSFNNYNQQHFNHPAISKKPQHEQISPSTENQTQINSQEPLHTFNHDDQIPDVEISISHHSPAHYVRKTSQTSTNIKNGSSNLLHVNDSNNKYKEQVQQNNQNSKYVEEVKPSSDKKSQFEYNLENHVKDGNYQGAAIVEQKFGDLSLYNYVAGDVGQHALKSSQQSLNSDQKLESLNLNRYVGYQTPKGSQEQPLNYEQKSPKQLSSLEWYKEALESAEASETPQGFNHQQAPQNIGKQTQTAQDNIENVKIQKEAEGNGIQTHNEVSVQQNKNNQRPQELQDNPKQFPQDSYSAKNVELRKALSHSIPSQGENKILQQNENIQTNFEGSTSQNKNNKHSQVLHSFKQDNTNEFPQALYHLTRAQGKNNQRYTQVRLNYLSSEQNHQKEVGQNNNHNYTQEYGRENNTQNNNFDATKNDQNNKQLAKSYVEINQQQIPSYAFKVAHNTNPAELKYNTQAIGQNINIQNQNDHIEDSELSKTTQTYNHNFEQVKSAHNATQNSKYNPDLHTFHNNAQTENFKTKQNNVHQANINHQKPKSYVEIKAQQEPSYAVNIYHHTKTNSTTKVNSLEGQKQSSENRNHKQQSFNNQHQGHDNYKKQQNEDENHNVDHQAVLLDSRNSPYANKNEGLKDHVGLLYSKNNQKLVGHRIISHDEYRFNKNIDLNTKQNGYPQQVNNNPNIPAQVIVIDNKSKNKEAKQNFQDDYRLQHERKLEGLIYQHYPQYNIKIEETRQNINKQNSRDYYQQHKNVEEVQQIQSYPAVQLGAENARGIKTENNKQSNTESQTEEVRMVKSYYYQEPDNTNDKTKDIVRESNNEKNNIEQFNQLANNNNGNNNYHRTQIVKTDFENIKNLQSSENTELKNLQKPKSYVQLIIEQNPSTLIKIPSKAIKAQETPAKHENSRENLKTLEEKNFQPSKYIPNEQPTVNLNQPQVQKDFVQPQKLFYYDGELKTMGGFRPSQYYTFRPLHDYVQAQPVLNEGEIVNRGDQSEDAPEKIRIYHYHPLRH